MLEIISLGGNVRLLDEKLDIHAHVSFSFLEKGQPAVLAGHLSKARISYTAEIRLSPIEGAVTLIHDDETGIDVWDLKYHL